MDCDRYLAVHINMKNISKMNNLKSHYKLAITDETLQSILMTEITNSESQLSEMLSPKIILFFSFMHFYNKKLC